MTVEKTLNRLLAPLETNCRRPLAQLWCGLLTAGPGHSIVTRCIVASIMVVAACGLANARWQPVKGPLMTRWAKDVRPDNVHREYPRPQMVRRDWMSLNGLWEYAILPEDAPEPKSYEGEILVPFAVESSLSGVGRAVGTEKKLWYRRSFEIPNNWQNKRILLNFEAVDWETTVWVNGKKLGTHRGGYDPFTFDITDALEDAGTQEIVVSVWDSTDDGRQARGKQKSKPRRIWYTSTTGIWQSVWLEPVDRACIRSLKIVTDIDAELVSVTAVCSGDTVNCSIEAQAKDKRFIVSKTEEKVGKEINLAIKEPKLWSPDSPYLYDLKLTLKDSQGKKLDSVKSYFGMRKIALGKDQDGITRMFLNNKILFQYGPLDQGFWPDGVYTAPTDEALRYDIEMTKNLGCNMARKHVKIEPARWYYWADKLGLLLWQDMPNAMMRRVEEPTPPKFTEESERQFELELRRMVQARCNHPSIIMWVVFNEGWGQKGKNETEQLVNVVKDLDPTRLVNEASGWTNMGFGDIRDVHSYPGPDAPANEEKRAAVLGEFGGLGFPVPGHLWHEEASWGHHGTVKTTDMMTENYVNLLAKVSPLIEKGLCAAVYTQTTDVETEVNGLITYDRAMIKMDEEKVRQANKRLVSSLGVRRKSGWAPAKGPLMTRWAKDVRPDNVHKEYPRPQLVRTNWLNLNGLWQYAVTGKDQDKPSSFDGRILVPYPIESSLSGVMKAVTPQQRLWYRRTLKIPAGWKKKRVLLHFGAVDWDSTVWVNGKELGSHRGGYDPFTFDITDALKSDGPQEIILSVYDPTDEGAQPKGKQVLRPRGIRYTATTGIWQTVWLEPVERAYIKKLKIVTDIDAGVVTVNALCSKAAAGLDVEAEVKDGWFAVGKRTDKVGKEIILPIKNAKLWSPDSPFLYDLNVTLKDGSGRGVDSVKSYFGMRKVSLGKDEKQIPRILLNNEVLFQYGPLDQGFWPDGLHTAPTDKALRYDIEVLKKLGCNMMRKHVKVEPDRLYYWCDKLGLLIWQDMASGKNKGEEGQKQFELELTRMIDAFGNHPSIIIWVIFNEGWGQHDNARLTHLVKSMDPTRLVNSASGWHDRGVGDIRDIHMYPGPAAPLNEKYRAAVLGEFGGLGLPVSGHTWQDEKNWGYRSFETFEELTDAYVALLERLHPLIGAGLCAAVYTQTSDVEIEVNGLMTYDRAMVKMDEALISAANRKLYQEPPSIRPVVPLSGETDDLWRYTTTKPADDWSALGFDDSTWRSGRGGFGLDQVNDRLVVRTQLSGEDTWFRRQFELTRTDLANPNWLVLSEGVKARIYLNGELLARAGRAHGPTRSLVALDQKGRQLLKPGRNVMGLFIEKTRPLYLDVALVELIE